MRSISETTVLRHCQHYFSHITATAYKLTYSLGFTSTRVWLQSVLSKETLTKNPQDQVQLEPWVFNLRVTERGGSLTTKQN